MPIAKLVTPTATPLDVDECIGDLESAVGSVMRTEPPLTYLGSAPFGVLVKHRWRFHVEAVGIECIPGVHLWPGSLCNWVTHPKHCIADESHE
jgi:hypothetical protein